MAWVVPPDKHPSLPGLSAFAGPLRRLARESALPSPEFGRPVSRRQSWRLLMQPNTARSRISRMRLAVSHARRLQHRKTRHPRVPLRHPEPKRDCGVKFTAACSTGIRLIATSHDLHPARRERTATGTIPIYTCHPPGRRARVPTTGGDTVSHDALRALPPNPRRSRHAGSWASCRATT